MDELLEDPKLLAGLCVWTEPVCEDLLAVERGELTEEGFRDRYLHRKAILVLDITGFTTTALKSSEVHAFLRILNVQKLCQPILQRRGASLIRAFADDIVALFDDPNAALDAAFEIHEGLARRTGIYQAAGCIGIGYGDVFAIGPNLAMGNEMNCASKLGEDTACAGETLLTENAYEQLRDRGDVRCELRAVDELPFKFFSATPNSA
ncbi:adenylate/guanylate cyclase domain-containing protein [Lentzea tibetensis]|uniref:Adenylate/guanylate cyclase domain-containing protein n=1 Tax=Lentzea tibetensis TaxID=2591470 RepID=A0A563EZ25_9PSEU|nr:adenylate/guanylate cyclase domain-containing protein [Lentzea tibetensis]TWP52919.1 adenylate/guanylate cyclase domain-containing protein [Lentzea tibetensis]